MKKFYTPVIAFMFLVLPVYIQAQAAGSLGISSFATKITVPFVMPDGTKLMTDVYLPRLTDSLRLSLGKIVLLGDTILTDSITLLHAGQQIIFYDSLNGQPNPNPYQLPTIFTRTPYGKGGFNDLGAVMPLLGYTYAYQDMRGAYSSEGDYFPLYSDSWNKNAYHTNGHILDYLSPDDPKFSNKQEDGYNSIKFIQDMVIPGLYDSLPHTNEKLNNGSIGMFGPSAMGITQLQAGLAHRIPDSLPALKCLMPIVATTEHFIATGFNNGVFRPGIVTAWLKGQIFDIINDNLIPVDDDRQNSIHTSYDYNLPQQDTLNGVVKSYGENKFDAATLAIDQFTVRRLYRLDGTLSPAGFYPNSAGRSDIDASDAPVNENGEAVDPVTQQPLPYLNYSRYTNLDVPCFHISGWWDIFTEGQINTVNNTVGALTSNNKTLQKLAIGPWAHQTTCTLVTGDRTYPANVNDITQINLTNFSLSNLPLSQVLASDLITWYRYNLNYNSSNFIGEPKFILQGSHQWQFLGITTALGGADSLFVLVPSQNYIIPFVKMMNFLSGNGGLDSMPIEVRIANGLETQIYESVPILGTVLSGSTGGAILGVPYKDFESVPNVRYYVVGPDSAADAAAGYPNNYQMGNYWNTTDRFPPTDHIQWQRMYLHQNGTFNFTAPTADEGFGMYVCDPDNPVQTVGGSNMLDMSPDGTRITQGQIRMSDSSNAPFTMDREGVIQFNSSVFTDSFAIAGFPLVDLFGESNPGGISSGLTDCDWDVRICDVWPNGQVYFVQEGIVNARARDWARALVDSMTIPGAATCYNGVEDPNDKNIPYTNINIGQMYEYIYKMLPIAYCWAPGHQIRVLVSSANYTKYQANANIPLNDGEFFRRNPGDGQSYNFQGVDMMARVAVQRVHFSPENPTNIAFPVFNQSFISTGVPVVSATSNFDINVFPNPATDKIQVFANQQGNHELSITDITGNVITTAQFDDNLILNTTQYSKGIYFVTVDDVNNSGNRITRKFVVQ
jgi:predicted acyl esterase